MGKKKISILGSTGSIGVNTLRVLEDNPDRWELIGLSAGENLSLLIEQIKKYNPRVVAIRNKKYLPELKKATRKMPVECLAEEEGIVRVATLPEVDMVVSAIVGAAGLVPTYEAVRAKKDIALANKETLVVAGELIMKEAKGRLKILPVDSEHSAIFQALNGEDKKAIKKLILTASGGPFHRLKYKDLEKITLQDALRHPTWQMGKKITIDSSTLMNKGFEVIEARWLFGVDVDRIEVVIHPQSIIHSLVEFVDGSVMGQMGLPDMRLPIAYALNFPKRYPLSLPSLNLAEIGKMTFKKPDRKIFACLNMAYEAIKKGGTMPAVLNAANEVAVNAFLKEEISFLSIPQIIKETLLRHEINQIKSLSDGIKADQWARVEAKKIIEKKHLNK